MDDKPDVGRIRRSLQDALAGARFNEDFADVQQRAHRQDRTRRMGVAGASLALATGAVLVAVLAFFPLAREGQQGTASPSYADSGVPEGQLVLGMGDTTSVFRAGADASEVIHPAAAPYDVSPDGGTIVGTFGEQLPPGSYRRSEIVLVDASTGSARVVAAATEKQGFSGPIEFSPDGRRIAYVEVTWSVDPAQTHPSEGTEELALCLLELDSATSSCYPDIGTIKDLEWAPDGMQLGVELADGLSVVDVSSGESRGVIRGTDSALSQVAASAGIENVSSTSVDLIAWSPSGRYLSTVVAVGTPAGFAANVPIVVNLQGDVMAQGRPNPDAQLLAWSPTADRLAYSVGVVGVEPPQAPAHGVRELDPASGDDRVLFSTDSISNIPEVSDPFVLQLAWAPSGRWLAIGGRDQVVIVDVLGDEAPRVIDPYAPGDEGTIVAWGS